MKWGLTIEIVAEKLRNLLKWTNIFIPPRTKFRGVYRNYSVCPSVRLSVRPSVLMSVQICVQPITFLWFDIGLPVYQHETMCRVHSWSWYDLELWPQGQIYRVFDMFSCPAINFFLDWHWLTIFGTWMYHHQTMCRVHSWSWFNVDLWPQGQIYRVYDIALCSGLSFFVL